MAIQRLNQANNFFVQPFGAAGTYTLSRPLLPGFYLISTDTTQTFTTAQLYFQTAAGYRFGVTLRGGQGSVSIPDTVTQVVFTTGTFPLTLGMELIPSYLLMDAPTVTPANVTFYAQNTSGVNPTLDMTFTAPAGATGIGIYWNNGTFSDLGAATSPKTGVSLAAVPTVGVAYPFAVVAKDANGVWGNATVVSKVYPFQTFFANGTYVTPAGSTTANVLVLGGGGGGGGNQNTTTTGGGGGGGGRANYQTAVSTTGSISVTVGAGGAASNGGGNVGSQSVFGAITSAGGNGGGSGTGTAPAGGSSGSGSAGGAGASGVGGGGGGQGGVGTAASGANGGAGGTGSTVFGIQVAGGGGGGSAPGGTRGNATFGGGVGGDNSNNGGTAGTANRGGGGGGARRIDVGGNANGGAGGSGMVIVEAL